MESLTRRGFAARSAQLAASTLGVSAWQLPLLAVGQDASLSPGSDALAGRVFTAVKWGMIEGPETVLGKFQLCQELGFDGMELVSPADFTAEEVREASAATGMPVHGVVDMKHWDIRLSSPDESVRSQGVEILCQAIRDAKAFGGDSVLLVPGKVTDQGESHDEVWQRSIAGIREVLPLASRLGVRVLIENVWNGFCETPEQLRDYADEINSPWVGLYFDMGNAQTFAPTQDWIRVLGDRIVKLDIKGWGDKWKESRGFCKIGDGDIDWPEVCRALNEINYSGWCTAEVPGGDREELADIAERMNRVLQLKPV